MSSALARPHGRDLVCGGRGDAKLRRIRRHRAARARPREEAMKKKRISSPQVPEPPPQTWSNCLVVGNQVFIAGMTCRNGTDVVGGDSMYEQAKAVFTKIRHLIEAAGGKADDIVKVDIFVTDIKRREEVWKARAELFSGDFPVSTLVEVRALEIGRAHV